jgi:hypothetical protein
MDNTNPRTLEQIANDIRARTESVADAIAIGGLLLEAQERVDHGGWLLWLDREFDFSARTAQNYMSSHEFAAKYATVAQLGLTCSALYALSSGDYSDGEVNAVLTVAADERVNRGRLQEIIDGLKIEEAEAEEEKESDTPPGGGSIKVALGGGCFRGRSHTRRPTTRIAAYGRGPGSRPRNSSLQISSG